MSATFMKCSLVATLAFGFLCGRVALGDNLIANGGFETGTFSGWSVINAPVGSDLYVSAGNGHSGTYAAAFGAVGPYDDTIAQSSLPTIPGEQYTIDFWLAHPYTDSENDFLVAWNGNTVMSLLDTGHFDYTEYSFSVVGTGSDTLQFSGREVPGWFYLDDVSMSASGGPRSTPEPSTLVLLGIGAITFVAYAWRRRARAS